MVFNINRYSWAGLGFATSYVPCVQSMASALEFLKIDLKVHGVLKFSLETAS